MVNAYAVTMILSKPKSQFRVNGSFLLSWSSLRKKFKAFLYYNVYRFSLVTENSNFVILPPINF